MGTKIHTIINLATMTKVMAMPPSQTINQLFSVATSVEEAAILKIVVATPVVTGPLTILKTIRARPPEGHGKIDQLIATTMEIAIPEVEDPTTALMEGMETTTATVLTNATILTASAITDHMVKTDPKDSLMNNLMTSPPTNTTEEETAVQNAEERECEVEASEVTILEAKTCVEVPSGEVKVTLTLAVTLVHIVETTPEIVVAEECVEVDKEHFKQTHTRVVMEEKSPSLKKQRATTNTEKRS